MNKKFSTLVGCLLLGTMFSANAQNLPKWYAAGEADFKDPVATDFTTGKVERFDLSQVLAPVTGGRYVYSNPLNDVVVGMNVAFDLAAPGVANVASGTELAAGMSSAWENITTPVYGDFNGGFGIVPSMNNSAEFLMVISTNGLSNPTNIEFAIEAAKKGANPNRTIDWTITAVSYDLVGNVVNPTLNLTGVPASGSQTIGTSLAYTANNAAIVGQSSLKVRINEAENGGLNSLANKVIIVKVTNAAASVADGGNEAQNKLEPITVIKNLSFDYQRPEVTLAVAPTTEFNAGAGYVANGDLSTTVEFYNPSETGNAPGVAIPATAANLGLGAISAYKLDVTYPFVLAAADAARAFHSTATGDTRTYYFDMSSSLFTIDPIYDGTNNKRKLMKADFDFDFAPAEVLDFVKKEYITASVTSVNTSFAKATLDGTSVPSFVITPALLAFDEYEQTLSANITVANLPKYAAGEWIVNQTKNSMKPLQPYCEVVIPAFEGFLGTTSVTPGVANAAFATTFLDASGNLLPAYDHVKVYIDYKRGNVSTELNQSVNFQEVFRLNEALTYTSPRGAAFSYTGANLVGHIKGAIYPNDLKVTGNNQYVWFSYGSNGSVAEAMGLPDGQEFNGHYVRHFYAPFEANATEEARTSRVDTIFIHTAHLVADADNKATIKFAIDGNDVSNDFRFKAGDAYGLDVAYFVDPVSHRHIAANQNFRGGANTDTLYYVIDLNNEAMVKAVKTKGLELNMKYIADTENWSEAVYNGAETQTFKVTTADTKGDNIFWATGLTDRGVTTNMYALDYKDWYRFLWNGNPNGVFEDQFRNNYGTHYINTCVAADSSSFIVAGINLVDPVKVELKSNQANSFVYVQNEVSKDYGTFDPATMTITPNKFGEIYAKIDVKFAPTKNDTAKDSIISEKKYTKKVFRKFIYDNIALSTPERDDHFATKFYGMGELIHQTVDTLFNQRDNMGANIVENNPNGIFIPNEFVSQLFENAGFDYQADSVYAVIHGDAKKPAVKFVDANGVELKSLDFGKTYFGTKSDIEVKMIGTELPFEDLTWPVDVASTINFANSNVAIYPTADAEFKIFDRSAILGQETVVPVKVSVKPSVGTPCDTKADLTVSVPVLCDVTKTIPATFVPALHAPGKKAFAPGDIQGDRANLLWTPEFKASEVEHNVTIGLLDYNKKSSSIFISEVYSNGNKAVVELFNGTGIQLNADIFGEQSPNYYLEYKEGDKVIMNAAVIANDTESNKILEPYGCATQEYVYAFKANTLYTVTLKQGNIAMDQFQFSTSATHMGRRDDLIKAGEAVTEANDPYRQGKYDQAQWTNTNTWNMGLESNVANFAEMLDYNQTSQHPTAFVSKWDAAKSSMSGLYEGSEIKGLHNNVTYSVWVKPVLLAGMECVADENVDVLKLKVATSDSKLDGGSVIADITFDYPTANEGGIDGTIGGVQVVPGTGDVAIKNAEGKTVAISNILGQTIAKTRITSDNAIVSVPAGIVVVSVEGEAAVKVIVK